MIKYRAKLENIVDSVFHGDPPAEGVNVQYLKSKILLFKSKLLDDEFIESELKLSINEKLPDSKIEDVAIKIEQEVKQDIPQREVHRKISKRHIFFLVLAFLSLAFSAVLNIFLFFSNNKEALGEIVWHNLFLLLLFTGSSLAMFFFIKNTLIRKTALNKDTDVEERTLLARRLFCQLLEDQIYSNSFDKGA